MQSVLCSEFNPVSIDPTELMETGVDGWRREEGSTSNPHRSDKRAHTPLLQLRQKPSFSHYN